MAKQPTINKVYVEKYLVDNGYPEVGTFTDKKDLQRFYKHVPTEQLVDWAVEVEGIEVTKVESEPIYRMRLAMAILYLHFPKAPSTKKQAKYAQYTLEDLMKMATDKDVIFEVTDDERILRMRAIMALRVAGHIE